MANYKKSRLWKTVRNIIKGRPKKDPFQGSKNYWEQRYKSNRNSGAGSYGKLAIYKAEILNEFVKTHNIKTVIELGSGDGNQLALANYPKYTGFDVSETILKSCREKFANDKTKEFFNTDSVLTTNLRAELVLSLDVIYHLVEDEVFNVYMSQLFSLATKYVIIYASNYNENVASHVRCRKFTDWIEANLAKEWDFKELIKNKYPYNSTDPDNTSMADFYIYKKNS